MRSFLTKHAISLTLLALYFLFLLWEDRRENLGDPDYLFNALLSAWTMLPFYIYENVYSRSRRYFSNKRITISNALAFIAFPIATSILFLFTISDVFFSSTEGSSTASLGLLFISFWPLVFGAIPVLANQYFVSKAKKLLSSNN